jgi:hypothetical protein
MNYTKTSLKIIKKIDFVFLVNSGITKTIQLLRTTRRQQDKKTTRQEDNNEHL